MKGFCPKGVLSHRGFVPEGFCPRGFCPRGFCPRGVLSYTRMQHMTLAYGYFAQSRTENLIHVCPSCLAGLTDNTSSCAMK